MHLQPCIVALVLFCSIFSVAAECEARYNGLQYICDSLDDLKPDAVNWTQLHLMAGQSLDVDAFRKTPKLRVLTVSNIMVSINRYALRSLTRLEFLTLQQNNLKELPAELFSGLPLTKLQIQECGVEQIEDGTFDSLTNLTLLRIEWNNLWRITADVLSIKQLKKLSLCTNGIREIDEDVFHGMKQLTRLDLANNKLTTFVFEKYLVDTAALKYLNLAGNLLRKITKLPVLLELGELSLANNFITSVDREAFMHCEKLKRLDMSVNQLQTIEANYFPSKGFLHMEMFLISLNNIQCVSSEVLALLSNVKTVSWKRNNFTCSCFHDILKWASDNNVRTDLRNDRGIC